jgi:hypothetical protein
MARTGLVAAFIVAILSAIRRASLPHVIDDARVFTMVFLSYIQFSHALCGIYQKRKVLSAPGASNFRRFHGDYPISA